MYDVQKRFTFLSMTLVYFAVLGITIVEIARLMGADLHTMDSIILKSFSNVMVVIGN